MNGKIVYSGIHVEPDKIYNYFGNDCFPFAEPSQLLNTDSTPKDYALLLPNYIRLDGTKELLTDNAIDNFATQSPLAAQALSYTEDNWNKMLDNIRTLRGLAVLPVTTPDVPSSFNRPTIEMANDIERILYDAYQYAINL